jgi:hypothetical protein
MELEFARYGDTVLRLVGHGKPFDRFTLGEGMKLLQALEEPLVDLMARDCPVHGLERPLIGKSGVQLMDRLSRLRSDFAHGRWPPDRSAELTIEFLETSGELCQAPIVRLAIVLEANSSSRTASGSARVRCSRRPSARS